MIKKYVDEDFSNKKYIIIRKILFLIFFKIKTNIIFAIQRNSKFQL